MEKKSFKMGLLLGVIGTILFSLVGILAIFVFSRTGNVNLSEHAKRKINTIKQIINKNYLFEYDETDVEEAIYKGLLNGLGDVYTEYYTPNEYSKVLNSSAGVFAGIGINYIMDDETGYVYVYSLEEEGSAYEEGVKPGDFITEIEGQTVVGLTSSQMKELIDGEFGTTLEVTVLRNDKTLKFTLERRKMENVYVRYILLENDIGYIYISRFTDATVSQFVAAMDDLNKQGMKAVIFDIRNNPGGVLTSAVNMLDYLLPDGVLVYTENKSGKKKEYKSKDGNAVLNVPCVVLTNEETASASEIFAGALKDYGVAVTVGKNTFGKGIVQGIIPLDDGSAIKITTEKYFTPNGTDIHKKGIAPDIEVEYDKDKATEELIDTQYEKAREYLLEKINK